ncbi:SDR family NAD(P)-dependent oxidoreductase [Metabacillus fastidiosus]|uniref:SDR family NAD(P)-dependent oxidoreductase n=1 Tax=Metabacillus fastidiosus TaxID=1458 RepID=UPI003D29A107
MIKSILISNGNQPFNQLISHYLLENGHHVTMLFNSDEAALSYYELINQEWQYSYSGVVMDQLKKDYLQQVLDDITEKHGSLDVFIHGNEMVNEEQLLLQDAGQFDIYITEQFKRMYLLNKTVSSLMIKKKRGSIIFPIIYDALYYADYPSSPILNHGKISMMKCLSRELTAFKLSVNVMTFGYYNGNFNNQEKKEVRKALEIYGLKPQLYELKHLVPAIDILINPPVPAIGGHDFHIGAGIETGL